MKKSNFIIILWGGLMLSLLLVLFIVSKYIMENQSYDYNSKKYNLSNISTIVLDNQTKCYVSSGDNTVVNFEFWGKDENLPEKLCIKNDTLYLNYQFNKPETNIHIYCKNIKKFIVKNKSNLTINKYASDCLKVNVFSKSHVSLRCGENRNEEGTKNILNIDFKIVEHSMLSVTNSKLNSFKVVANNSLISTSYSEINIINLDLRSGSQFYENDIKCTESFQLKSDNKSKYSIQYNYNEKK